MSFFIDTNIIFYAYDTDGGEKHQISKELVLQSLSDRSGVISTQVLGEFFNSAVIRKKKMTPDEAESIVKKLRNLWVINPDSTMVLTAIDLHRRFQISYYDSLILAAAKRAGCDEVLSEDLSDGQDYDGVVVRNPF